MTDLDELKYNFFKDEVQLSLLDRSGFIAHSCNTLFDFDRYKVISIFDEIPMLESIADLVKNLKIGDVPVFLSRLELNLDENQRFLDFYFLPYEEDENILLFYILERTKFYTYLRNVVQQRNEMYISNLNKEVLQAKLEKEAKKF